MKSDGLRAWLSLQVFAIQLVATIGAPRQQQQPWPVCSVAATLGQQSGRYGRVEVPATSFGCRLVLAPDETTGRSGKLLADGAVIAGNYNGSLGRAPAVQIQQAAAQAGAAALVMPAGGSLLLQGLLIANTSLADPHASPSLALLPEGLTLPAGSSLRLRDVQVIVSQQQLQQYIVFMLGIPSVVLLTDSASYLFIRTYDNTDVDGSLGSPLIVANSVVLICPDGATVKGTPLRLLQSVDHSSSAGAAAAAAAATTARGDGAGIVNATDSYILGATNATFLPLLRQLAGQQDSRQPLLVILASNVTLSPHVWRSAWPAAGLNVTRQVVLVGSSSKPTSIDFGMEVGQVELVGQWANVTLFNIGFENLAYGNEMSGRDAAFNSILQPGQLWAFQYRRSVPRVVLWDCTLVLPGQRFVDSIVYWANAFNSDLEVWRSQAAFMRDTLGYTVLQYTDGLLPGEYIITAMQKADLRMFNTTLTTTPVAAPALPLPFNASIHQNVSATMADVAVGPIYNVEELALTLYNINKGNSCRSYALLPSNPEGGVLDWGPATLDYSHITTGIPPPSQQQQQQPTMSEPSGTGGAAAGTDDTVQHSLAAARAAWGADLTAVWPRPGGQICQCPVQFQGAPMVDLGFVRRMFVLQDPSGLQPGSVPGSAPGSQGSNGGSGLGSAPGANPNPTPLLKFVQMGLKGLPQGDAEKAAAGGGGSNGGSVGSAQTWTAPATAAAPTSSEAAGSVDGSTAGGSSWVSELPAEAYTHLLWFISRNIAGGDLVVLSNVTLIIPQPEAAQMAAAATAAVQAAGGRADQAVLSVVFPTTSGPLPVVYRSLLITNNVIAAGQAVAASIAAAAAASTNASSPAATSSDRRHLLQAAVAAGAGRQQLTFCAGTLHGLGVSGRNVCMVAAADSSGLPPDYVWPAASRSGSSSLIWPPWKVAILVLATVIGLLALALFAVTIVRRHGRRWQQRQPPQELPAVKRTGAGGGVSGQGPGWLAGSGASSSPDGTTSRCGSSESLKAYSSAIAQRLRDCCPGRQHDGSSSDAAKAPHSFSSAAASSAGAVILEAGGLQQQLQLAQPTAAAAAGAPQGPGDAATTVEGSLLLATAKGSQQFGQAQCSSAAAQPAVSTPQRLAGAINSVSAEMHSRRLTGLHSSGVSIHVTPPGSMRAASSLARLSSRSPPIAALPRKPSPGSGDGAAASSTVCAALFTSALGKQHSPRMSSGVAQQRQQFQQRQARLSINEEPTVGQQLLEQQQQQQAILAAEFAEATPTGSAGVTGADDPSSYPHQQQQQPSSPSCMAHQQQQQQLQLLEVIGSGTFGVVYRAIWRGIPAAVKVMQLPSAVGGSLGLEAGGMAAAAGSRREQMAVMETALGASLSHPNIVQVYTYMLRPLGHLPLTGSDEAAAADASSTLAAQGQHVTAAGIAATGGASGTQRGGSASSNSPATVTGYELQLVMEYCPLGSLRAAIDSCLLEDRLTGRPHYPTVLSLALGVARAMHHLHCEGVLHGDLKAGNVLLKLEYGPGIAGGGSAASSAAPAFSAAAGAAGAAAAGLLPGCEQLVAKVADLGLACMLDDPDTHISGVHRGTLSHMSPELLLHGHASRASDVYAMGILLFEAATGLRAFADVPRALLGAAVVRDRARPAWPHSSEDDTAAAAAAATGQDPAAFLSPPLGYRQLAEACWAPEPQDRLTFEEITFALEHLIEQEQQEHACLQAAFTPTHPEQHLPQEGTTAAPVEGSAFLSVGEVVGNGQLPSAAPAVAAAAGTMSAPPTVTSPATTIPAGAGAGAGQGQPSVRAVKFMPEAVQNAAAGSRAAPEAAASPAGTSRPAGQHVSAAAAAVAAVLGVSRRAGLTLQHIQTADEVLGSSAAGSAVSQARGLGEIEHATSDNGLEAASAVATPEVGVPAGVGQQQYTSNTAVPAAAVAAPRSPFDLLKHQAWE